MPSERATTVTNRRSFLKGGLAGLSALGLFSGAASAYHELEDDYANTYYVTDYGADPTGEESVTDVVEDLAGDDTLLRFPSGRYYLDRKFRFTDFENFGLAGLDATLVPASYHDFEGDDHKLFRLGVPYAPGTDLRIQNFTVDQTATDTGVRLFDVAVDDGLTVKDVHVKGRHDSGTWGPALFRVTDSDGTGVVERFRAPDGAATSATSPGDLWRGPTGILCTWAHEGDITFRDCELGGFPDNGLYASGGTGSVHVEGGRYANSGTASIRLGGHGVSVTDATVVVDDQPWDIPQEGLRLDYGDWIVVDGVTVSAPNPTGEAVNVGNGVDRAFLKHCDVAVGADAHVGVHVRESAGPTYLKDVDVEMRDSNNAVQIEGAGAGEVGLVDVSVTGDAGGETMRHAVRCLRDDCFFRRVSIDQTGGNKRRGIALIGERAYVDDCDISVAERGLSVMGDGAWIEDTRSRSYDEDRASIKLFDGVTDVRLKDNEFPNGIDT